MLQRLLHSKQILVWYVLIRKVGQRKEAQKTEGEYVIAVFDVGPGGCDLIHVPET